MKAALCAMVDREIPALDRNGISNCQRVRDIIRGEVKELLGRMKEEG